MEVSNRAELSIDQQMVVDSVIKRISELPLSIDDSLILYYPPGASGPMMTATPDGKIDAVFYFGSPKTEYVLKSDNVYTVAPDYLKLISLEFDGIGYLEHFSYGSRICHLGQIAIKPLPEMEPQIFLHIIIQTSIYHDDTNSYKTKYQ